MFSSTSLTGTEKTSSCSFGSSFCPSVFTSPSARKKFERLPMKAEFGETLPISFRLSALLPVSSKSSRLAATSAFSPFSTRPAGNSRVTALEPWRNCCSMTNMATPSSLRYQGMTVIHSGLSTRQNEASRPSVDRRLIVAISKIGPWYTVWGSEMSFHFRWSRSLGLPTRNGSFITGSPLLFARWSGRPWRSHSPACPPACPCLRPLPRAGPARWARRRGTAHPSPWPSSLRRPCRTG